MAIGKLEMVEMRSQLEKARLLGADTTKADARLKAAKERLHKIQKKKEELEEETRRMMEKVEQKRSEAQAALEKATSQVDQMNRRVKKLQENPFYMSKVTL